MRTAGSRTAADFGQLCKELEKHWYEVVREDEYGKEGGALSGVFVLRSMEASVEEGFVLPQVCVSLWGRDFERRVWLIQW